MSESATLCRFIAPHQTEPRVGLVHAGEIRDLWPAGVRRLDALLEDRFGLSGPLDDIVAFDDALGAYFASAARCPSFPALLDAFLEGS